MAFGFWGRACACVIKSRAAPRPRPGGGARAAGAGGRPARFARARTHTRITLGPRAALSKEIQLFREDPELKEYRPVL